MIENTAAAEKQKLSGHLGTVGVVFMVVAAAAPLTVIGGNMPLAWARQRGGRTRRVPHRRRGAPAVRRRVRRHDTACAEAGAFFSYVTWRRQRPGTGIAVVALIAYTAIQLGIYGYIGWAVGDPVQSYGGPDLPWPVYSFAMLRRGAVGLPPHRAERKGARRRPGPRSRHRPGPRPCHLRDPGRSGRSLSRFSPTRSPRQPRRPRVLLPDRLHRLRGHRGASCGSAGPGADDPRATYLAVLIDPGLLRALLLGARAPVLPGSATSSTSPNATLAGESNMLLDTTQEYLGTLGKDLVNLLLISSLFACVLSFHNVIARYQYVLARKGLLPASARPRHGVAALTGRLLGPAIQDRYGPPPARRLRAAPTGPAGRGLRSMAGVATVGMVILMLTTSVAVIAFFSRHPELTRDSVPPGRPGSPRSSPASGCSGASGWC